MKKNAFSIGVFILVLTSCGVKGKPLPPVEPVLLGDGTLKLQKKNKKPEARVRTKPAEEKSDYYQ